jgi:MoxR-like ATPase
MAKVSEIDRAILPRMEELSETLDKVRRTLSCVIIGQDRVIDDVLLTLLSGGHAILVGMPGLAKTRLVETLGIVLGMDERRIQFTPDLMPSDILGSEVLEESAGGARSFRFIEGPVFCQLLMADEINRASPRTQSALLQAMQERQVSVAGQRRDLPSPFHVLATQNPLEQEGTYPLPEAQLDRFLLQIDVDYPDREAERRVILATTGADEAVAKKVMSPATLLDAQRMIRKIPVGEKVVEAILDITRDCRPGQSQFENVKRYVVWGPGPRAGQALMLGTRARALLEGRLTPSVEDVMALAPAVLKHRMALNFDAIGDGIAIADIIGQVLSPHG